MNCHCIAGSPIPAKPSRVGKRWPGTLPLVHAATVSADAVGIGIDFLLTAKRDVPIGVRQVKCLNNTVEQDHRASSR